MRPTYGGLQVVVSPQLPSYPSHREDARRIVRHGMADVLAWLGQAVGPKPGEATHVVLGLDYAPPGAMVAFVSAEYHEQLRSQAPTVQSKATR